MLHRDERIKNLALGLGGADLSPGTSCIAWRVSVGSRRCGAWSTGSNLRGCPLRQAVLILAAWQGAHPGLDGSPLLLDVGRCCWTLTRSCPLHPCCSAPPPSPPSSLQSRPSGDPAELQDGGPVVGIVTGCVLSASFHPPRSALKPVFFLLGNSHFPVWKEGPQPLNCKLQGTAIVSESAVSWML